MKTTRIFQNFIITLALFILPLQTFARSTITVGPGEKYTTIQPAIDAADTNTLISIKSGTYKISKALEIKNKKQIILAGQGKVSIICTSDQQVVIQITDSYRVLIRGLHLTHEPKATGCAEGVININKGREIIITNCDINGCGVYGVSIYKSNRVAVMKSVLHNNEYNAISAYNSKEIVILENKIYKNGSSMNFSNITGLTIRKNEIYQNKKNNISYKNVKKRKISDNKIE